MVNRDADPVNVESSFAGQICCISTHVPNRVLFLNCPGQLYTFLHSALRSSYRLGIRTEQGQQSIVLNGMPFHAPGPGETFGPQIHCAIVRCMLSCGWELVCGSGISLRVADVHAMFFKKAKQTSNHSPNVCAISFIDSNIIRLIDTPVSLLEMIKDILHSQWRKGEKDVIKFKVQDGVPQFTLKGRVFDGMSVSDIVATRALLAQIISKMCASGYEIITSCPTKVSNAGMRPQELDTWIIRCPEELTPEERYVTSETQRPFRD